MVMILGVITFRFSNISFNYMHRSFHSAITLISAINTNGRTAFFLHRGRMTKKKTKQLTQVREEILGHL